MKKYIAAITAAALTLCTFTACSDKGSGSSSDIQSSAVSQEETQADSAPKVPDVPFDEETAKKTAAEAINGFFDSINSGDIEKCMKYQYSDDILEAAAVSVGYGVDGGTAEEAYKNMIESTKSSYSGHKFTLNSIQSIKPMNRSAYGLLDNMYSRIRAIKDIIDSYGADAKLNVQEITDKYNEIEKITVVPLEYEEGYQVTANISLDTETNDLDMFVFKIKGGDWMIDMTNVAYLEDAEQTDMDNDASDASYAASLALESMKKSGKDISGTFIISSDAGKNYLVPDSFDMNAFNTAFAANYKGASDADYFFVITDEIAKYGVYRTTDGMMGIYPFGLIIKDDGTDKMSYEELDHDKTYTLEELYDMSKSVIDQFIK